MELSQDPEQIAGGRGATGGAEAEAESKPRHTRWRLREGDQVVPGRTAIKRLGGGLRYEAYLAWDDRLRSLVVVKLVRPGLVEDRRTLEGLRSEVELLDRLNHPVIVRGFGAELDGPRPHVVLEHLEGPRLSSLIRKYGALHPEQLLSLGVQLCAAAHYLAGEDVVHLDIKPSNVIMGGPPRLIDLSVACTVEQCASLRSPVGTDAYMAPEQAEPEGGHPVGPAADVWGIGATLHEALTGERPFPKGDRTSVVGAERFPQLVEPAHAAAGDLSRSLVEPIAACLAPDPAARPSAGELADRLEVVLESLPALRLGKLKPRLRR